MEFKKDDSCSIHKSSFNPKVVFRSCPLFGVQITPAGVTKQANCLACVRELKGGICCERLASNYEPG